MTTIQSGTRMTLAEYRALPETDEGVWELVNGVLEQMPPPTADHQNLIDFLVSMINLYLAGLPIPLGWAYSGIGVILSENHTATPDAVFIRATRAYLIQGSFVEGAPDLAIEVLSSDRNRDLMMKRGWYAATGIPEYWILDPVNDTITVLELSGDQYEERAVLSRSNTLTTPAMPGFRLVLERLFGNPGRAMVANRS